MKRKVDPTMAMVYGSSNPLLIDAATTLLEEAGIPSLVKRPGTGGLMRIVAGDYSVYPAELYVRKEDEARALELLTLVEA